MRDRRERELRPIYESLEEFDVLCAVGVEVAAFDNLEPDP